MGAKQNNLAKYIFLGIFVLLLFLSFLIIKPFINAVLASLVIAYLFFPVFKFVNKIIPSKTISSLFVSLLIILLILLPFMFALTTSATEAQNMYLGAKEKILTGEIIDFDCTGKDTLLCKSTDYTKVWIEDPEVKFYLQDLLGRFASIIIDKTSEILFSLPGIVLQIVITFFIIYYIFKDAPAFVKKLQGVLPLKKKHQKIVYDKLKETTHAVLYGSILIAVIQGALGAIGFWIFGIDSFLIWGIIMAIFALVPIVGTAIIWMPAALYLIAKGATNGNPVLVWYGVGLLMYGTFIIASADNILKPKLIGNRSGMHPVLVLLGVLGGLTIFGFAGFLIGPLILAALTTFVDIYQKEKILS